MLTQDEQQHIEHLVERLVRAALTEARVRRSTLPNVAPKTAEASLARARDELRDYLKEAG